MINVWFDWNCIIGLEIDRNYSPELRQIRDWYKQGCILLCIPSTVRTEEHPLQNKNYSDENELNEKLRKVDLEGIEIRSPSSRFFSFPGLQPILIREIHDRVFPSVAFSLNDHAEKPRSMGRKWNNQKNDALNIYTFASWSEQDDVFVSADYGDVVNKRDTLYAPYKILVKRPVPDPANPNVQILKRRREKIPGRTVIRGHILDPFEAEKHLRELLEA
jgi:hypothetical protein